MIIEAERRVMEIDPDKFKNLLVHLLENLRMMEIEALALRTMYAAARGWDTPEALAANRADWESAMQMIRNHPNVKGQIARTYDPLIQTIKNAVDSAVAQQALTEFLKSWKPRGGIN